SREEAHRHAYPDRVYVFQRDDAAVRWEPRPQLGLHAAAAGRVTFVEAVPELAVALPSRVRGLEAMRLYGVPKLAAIALGAAEILLERASEYADTRVQFP